MQRARVLQVFDELIDLDSASRQERLASIFADDPQFHEHLEHLLAADSSADSVLARFDSIIPADSQESDPLHVAGRTISHFRVIEPIARGGMGVVYRAEDTRLGRTIALKFPLALRHVDSAAKQRFRNEARVAAALDHPNLCPVYEIDETPEGDLFYTMPLYAGETLKARIAREGRIRTPEAVGIAAQLASGLAAAHRAGVVHRDLKPGNIILLPDGSAKILDFGLAKASEPTLAISRGTLGTLSYMAPEQIHDGDVDQRADLWALGVVLYEMVTGTRPFAAVNETGTAHAILHDTPRRASELRKDIDRELSELIARLLRKDPAQRPQSADEVVRSLRGISIDESSYRARSPSRRKAMIAVTALVGVAVSVVLIAFLARDSVTLAPAPVSIAVLPFSASGDTTAEYLAIGISDGLATDLSRLEGVIAPSYLTTAQYGARTKSLNEIRDKLQVGTLLRGNVARINERVRVDAQLLDAKNGTELWHQRYDRPFVESARIERDIARAVIGRLGVHTTGNERNLLSQPATVVSPAYDAYLRARAVEISGALTNFFNELPPDNIRRAVSLYSQSRDLDPSFAPARARLAMMHAFAGSTYDTTEPRREQSRIEAEMAVRLDPKLPDAHEALASYWGLKGDLPKAITELRRAIEIFPHSGDLHYALADLLVREGKRDEAVTEYDEAIRLEPASTRTVLAQAVNYSRLRRREQAMRGFDRTILLAPDFPMARVVKGHSYLRWKGTADTLEAEMQKVPAQWNPSGMGTYARFTVFWVQRRYTEGLAMLAASSSQLSDDGLVYQPVSLMRAQIQESMGQRKLSRDSYTIARSVIADSLRVHPEDAHICVALGLADAALGRSAQAVSEARRAVALASQVKNLELTSGVMGVAIEVFAKARDFDAAFEMLELMFSMPAGREVTTPYLRAWPGFDPLRADPRYKELLVRFAGAQ